MSSKSFQAITSCYIRTGRQIYTDTSQIKEKLLLQIFIPRVPELFKTLYFTFIS